MPNQDGSLTAEEYRNLAAETDPSICCVLHQGAQSTAQSLATQMQEACDGTPSVLRYTEGGSMLSPPASTVGFQADLTIEGIAHLPTRVRGRHAAHPALQSMSDPMMQQQDTGAYPSVEDHLQRRTTAFLAVTTDAGHLRFKPLTPEQEDAIRNRSSTPAV